MRNMVLRMALGAAITLFAVAGASAAPVIPSQAAGHAVSVSGVTPVQYYDFCERLRYKCQYKYELGEEGDGNCRRYREECGGRRQTYCERLRYKCQYKYERGEEGEGNCRRYREECGRY
jgi:hypothetical protein